MTHKRKLTEKINATLKRGKSILLLGPRQTGKTTLITQHISYDIHINLIKEDIRISYEKDPALLEKEIRAYIHIHKKTKPPIIFIDEVQKVPQLLNTSQALIDDNVAQFIFSGSSARKLKRGHDTNLLPGRIVSLRLDPFMLSEMPENTLDLDQLLTNGSLPGILATQTDEDKEDDLRSYVTTYLEEEIRSEAVVRQIGSFAQFLELAAAESGKTVNFTKLSNQIGIAQTTITTYYQILEDCLIAHRIDPYTKNSPRNRLAKSPKFLFFDLGVRRASAREGINPNVTHKGHLFEQLVGLELIRESRFLKEPTQLKFWRDHNGPEVDFILENPHFLIPIEVKLTDTPTQKDARHLQIFLDNYPTAKMGFIICQCTSPLLLNEKIMAIPWKDIQNLKFLTYL
jgi:predicted AAA+ superfamily ATPase